MRYARQSLFFHIHSNADETERSLYELHYGISDNNSFFMENFIIRNYKNFYLSFTEKTYNDVSYLYVVYLLKLNYDVNYMLMRRFYDSKISNELVKDRKYFFFDYKFENIRLHKINM
jgi:hypothetical protein